METLEFTPSRLRTALRLVRWTGLTIQTLLSIMWDRLRGRRQLTDVARRIRIAIERAGGTFVKIGQQMGNRVDLLPYTLCQELSHLYDHMPSFPFEEAIRKIEQASGRPLHEVFARFDPEPIGAASIACVFQAELLSGEKVAVKVRRPEIGTRFAEDLLALSWLCTLAEGLTIIRPGFTKSVRADLQNMLMEEMNFVAEARYQELFRRRARRDRIKYLTAPRIYPHLSNLEVLVQEFIPGFFLSEILDAHEANDEEQLAYLAQHGITPKEVARRLMHASYWSNIEGLFFHADPHPANIIVQPGNMLVFIDFGACGASSSKARRLMIETLTHINRDDMSSASRTAIRLLEPLPHIDVDQLVGRAEQVWWRHLYALRSKHTPWWARTTAGLWLSLFEITREFGLQVNLDTLRSLRASLLYDTLAARLWPKLSDATFKKYLKTMYRRQARRVLRKAEKESPAQRSHRLINQVHSLSRLGEKLVASVQNLTELSPNRFLQLANKASYAALNVLGTAAWLILPAFLMALSNAGFQFFTKGLRPPILLTAWLIWLHPAYVVYAVITAGLAARRMQFRFADSDHD